MREHLGPPPASVPDPLEPHPYAIGPLRCPVSANGLGLRPSGVTGDHHAAHACVPRRSGTQNHACSASLPHPPAAAGQPAPPRRRERPAHRRAVLGGRGRVEALHARPDPGPLRRGRAVAAVLALPRSRRAASAARAGRRSAARPRQLHRRGPHEGALARAPADLAEGVAPALARPAPPGTGSPPARPDEPSTARLAGHRRAGEQQPPAVASPSSRQSVRRALLSELTRRLRARASAVIARSSPATGARQRGARPAHRAAGAARPPGGAAPPPGRGPCPALLCLVLAPGLGDARPQHQRPPPPRPRAVAPPRTRSRVAPRARACARGSAGSPSSPGRGSWRSAGDAGDGIRTVQDPRRCSGASRRRREPRVRINSNSPNSSESSTRRTRR